MKNLTKCLRTLEEMGLKNTQKYDEIKRELEEQRREFLQHEKIAREASYEKNEEYIKEGHELHMIRISIHRLCVEAADNEWKRDHECPIDLFSEKLERLIWKAVDIGNWASIENYDPTEGFDY